MAFLEDDETNRQVAVFIDVVIYLGALVKEAP